MVSGVNLKSALVVGIDPGVTTGIAILDSNGNVLDIYSKRDINRAEIIRHVLKFGKPIVVSSDIKTAPRSVEKIAVKLGCVLYSPKISPSVKEKKDLTREYYSSLINDHEVDALAGAIKAWEHHKTLFSKIDDVLKKFGKQEIFPKVVLKILKEESPNIEDAVREFVGREEPEIKIETMPSRNSEFDRLRRILDEKQEKIESLHNQNVLLSRALNDAKREIGRIQFEPRDATESRKEPDYLNHIKKLRRIENKGYYPIVEFDKVDGDSLESAGNKIDLYNRVVLVNETSNLNILNPWEIKCLLVLNEIAASDIENLEFPIIEIDKSSVENFDDIKAIKIDYIEKRLADAKKSGLVGWLRGYRKRKD